MKSALIPSHSEGKANDLDYTESYPSEEEAKKYFERTYQRMLTPNVWHQLAGKFSAEFALVSEGGAPVNRFAKAGDYLKIDIPGPGPKSGEGYDWVKIESVVKNFDPAGEEEWVGMTVRPCANPQNATDNTAHFFDSKATSTFIVRRKHKDVITSYHGRNEVPNINTEKTIDNLRNALITSGALAGLSEAQWATLIKAFIKEENVEL